MQRFLAVSLYLSVLIACGDDDGVADGGIDATHDDAMDAPPDGMDTDGVDAPITARPLAFISSEVVSGDNVRDGSATCRRLAEAAGYEGSWFAWHSTFGRDPLRTQFGRGPWHDVDGNVVFRNQDALRNGPSAPLTLDEQGNARSGEVWSGSMSNGQPSGDDCRKWRSYYAEDSVTVGDIGATGSDWMSARQANCGTSRRLVCFEDTSFPSVDGLPLATQWNELALTAIRRQSWPPPAIARAFYMLSVAMFDAWAVASGDATPVTGVSLSTSVNPAVLVSRTAAAVFVELFKRYEEATGHAEILLAAQLAGAQEGQMEAEAIIEAVNTFFDDDGSGSGFVDRGTHEYGAPYRPTNSANPSDDNAIGGDAFDPNRWTPLRVPTGTLEEDGVLIVNPSDDRSYQDQSFITPHWGSVRTFALASGDAVRPPAPPQLGSSEPYTDGVGATSTNDEAFRAQVAEVLAVSAALTIEERVSAEYWADGPRSETPPGHWNQIAHGVVIRENMGLADELAFYLALNGALHDAAIAAWDAKRVYDYVRPITAIRTLYAGMQVTSWAFGGGTSEIDGSDWMPYQAQDFITPAFAEYVSGHSTFSGAAAEVFRRITGSDVFYDGTTRTGQDIDGDGEEDLLGQHVIDHLDFDPELTTEPVVLTWPTFSDAAADAGRSRIYGGIHFQDGDLRGREMGRAIGEAAVERVNAL